MKTLKDIIKEYEEKSSQHWDEPDWHKDFIEQQIRELLNDIPLKIAGDEYVDDLVDNTTIAYTESEDVRHMVCASRAFGVNEQIGKIEEWRNKVLK